MSCTGTSVVKSAMSNSPWPYSVPCSRPRVIGISVAFENSSEMMPCGVLLNR